MNKRFSQNFQLLASYTLSKAIDDNPHVYALNPGPEASGLVQDPSHPQSDRGLGSNDQRHRFATGVVWTLNYGSSLPKVARRVLQGWELSGIFNAQSGQPYSGLINFDLNNDGVFATDRAPGLGRNTFHMPASVSLAPRLTRNIKLGERANVQIIWEAFNVLNHANITYVNNIQYTVSRSDCGIAPSPVLCHKTRESAPSALLFSPLVRESCNSPRKLRSEAYSADFGQERVDAPPLPPMHS